MGLGVYYVNGMMRDEANVEDVRKKIGRITNSTHVHVQQNDSADTKRVVTDLSLVISGAILAAYSAKLELQGKGDNVSRVVGAVGAIFIILGIMDYQKIQEEKNAIANDLAGRVLRQLDKHPLNKALIVLHSQGADVGYRALQRLTLYAKRIRVVTLGPMTTIPKNLCQHVTNFKFGNDYISRGVAYPFEMVRKHQDGQERDVTFLKGDGLMAHGADDYLKDKAVQNTLRCYAL